MEQAPEITIEQAERMHADGVRWIDVREPDEWRVAAIADTELAPRAGAAAYVRAHYADLNEPILVSCKAGGRSMQVVRELRAYGYVNALNVAGGIDAWIDSGRAVISDTGLSPQQLERYSRHIAIPEIGITGQQRLQAARVLLLGAGALGSSAGLYLAAAGIGTLGIVDDDVVERSNLQRQVIHSEETLTQPKVHSAARAIHNLNPDVEVCTFHERFSADNALRTLDAGWDVIVDGSDNLPTRYLVNDAALMRRICVVHGSIHRFEGRVTVLTPFAGPCYRCMFPAPPSADLVPSCAEAGVLGALPGIVGSLQAIETIKVILKIGDPLVGRLWVYDALSAQTRTVSLARDPACAGCNDAAPISELVDYDALCRS